MAKEQSKIAAGSTAAVPEKYLEWKKLLRLGALTHHAIHHRCTEPIKKTQSEMPWTSNPTTIVGGARRVSRSLKRCQNSIIVEVHVAGTP